jgi:hypothetical protein
MDRESGSTAGGVDPQAFARLALPDVLDKAQVVRQHPLVLQQSREVVVRIMHGQRVEVEVSR